MKSSPQSEKKAQDTFVAVDGSGRDKATSQTRAPWTHDWDDETLAKCKNWLVMENVVYVMPKADPKQTIKDRISTKVKGDILCGEAVKVDGWMWLNMTNEGRDAWILIDGAAVNAKEKFLQPVLSAAWLG